MVLVDTTVWIDWLRATDTGATRRLAALLDPRTGLYGSHPSYYDQNLALFGEGWQQQRYRFSSDGQLLLPWSEATGRPAVVPFSSEKKK